MAERKPPPPPAPKRAAAGAAAERDAVANAEEVVAASGAGAGAGAGHRGPIERSESDRGSAADASAAAATGARTGTGTGTGAGTSAGPGSGLRRPTERRPRKILVPDVTGLNFDDAGVVLQQAGFGPPQARYTEAYATPDTVVEQIPGKGHLVDSTTIVQLHVARQSWVRYLPQLYQEATTGDNGMLHEFLWIFQQVQDSVDRQISQMPALFSPLQTPDRFVPWLSGWMALQVEADWPLEQQRRWLRHAPALYAIRGTKQALQTLLDMYLGEAPTILENQWPFEPFRIGVASEVGISTTVLPPMELAHCFVVQLPQPAEHYSDEQIVRIHRVIQAEKPAHTQYFLTFAMADDSYELQPFLTIGEDALTEDAA